MATRKHIWDAMDKLEGKKVGSSHEALNKERVRQGYKASALKKKTGHTHSYHHADVGRDISGKGGYKCTSCGEVK